MVVWGGLGCFGVVWGVLWWFGVFQRTGAQVLIDVSLVFLVCYHFEKSAITACRGKNTPKILYSATVY